MPKLTRRQFGLSAVAAAGLRGQNLMTERWPARWIAVPDTAPRAYGVYLFRKSLDLSAVPSSFKVNVTGDARYRLFVNGQSVVFGPARGDLLHWRYETVDVAKYLRTGKNVLAAVVLNEGEHTGLAQISNRTGFLLQGEGVNTDTSWKCFHNIAYNAYPITPENRIEYWAMGPGDEVGGNLHPWGWEQPDFDDSKWKQAAQMSNGAPRDASDGPNRWMLVPRPIPFMEESPQRLARVRRASGVSVPSEFPMKAARLTVPANTRAVVLLDQNHLTTAFPELAVSGGKGSRISLKYTEAMRTDKSAAKTNRDEVEGKKVFGPEDIFHADGGERRLYRPLYWRTYRYLELTVETKDQPLIIEDLRATYTGYPFERVAKFNGGPEDAQRILDIGWRTARLCAHETYMDCPFYEQLQYAGDTRIQAMVSVYNSGDTRLMRNAIEQIDSSRTAEGATFSRAPSAQQQYIPPFSLWWIGMVHDYWMYANDPSFVREMLTGVRAVLGFYSRYQHPDGHLRPMPWWNYIDWVDTKNSTWVTNTGPKTADGMSAVHDLQLLLAYQWAAQMELALGERFMATKYEGEASKLSHSIRDRYWDPGAGFYFDNIERNSKSQHANSLAVLANVSQGLEAKSVMERALADPTFVRASIYFTYYVRMAMRKAGLGNRYLDLLERPWRAAIADGLTTWPEGDTHARSDCHAWGSSPNIEFFRTVLGIDTAAPGWSRVAIRPHLGTMQRASGLIPHPAGRVEVDYRIEDGHLKARVVTPVEGDIEWNGIRRPLRAGENEILC